MRIVYTCAYFTRASEANTHFQSGHAAHTAHAHYACVHWRVTPGGGERISRGSRVAWMVAPKDIARITSAADVARLTRVESVVCGARARIWLLEYCAFWRLGAALSSNSSSIPRLSHILAVGSDPVAIIFCPEATSAAQTCEQGRRREL